MRRPDCRAFARLLWARSMTQPAPETIRTPKTRIACDGTGDGLAAAALGHPRIWLEIATDEGFVDCGYYDRRFVLFGDIADNITEPAASPIGSAERSVGQGCVSKYKYPLA